MQRCSAVFINIRRLAPECIKKATKFIFPCRVAVLRTVAVAAVRVGEADACCKAKEVREGTADGLAVIRKMASFSTIVCFISVMTFRTVS